MADFVRRFVSGNKARFKDYDLHLDLDLVYVTDQIIIMGFPASGIEGLYRNRRADAKRFLDYRHDKNYWIYNFCPIKENSYPATYFEGRVSRYPFPDHYAPPLALLPIIVRDMRAWLDGSSERVAVLHCKAGKGRSGTLACAYLLSLDSLVLPPRLQRSYNTKEWARLRANLLMTRMPDDTEYQDRNRRLDSRSSQDEEDSSRQVTDNLETSMGETKGEMGGETTPGASPPTAVKVDGTNVTQSEAWKLRNTLEDVLDLHTARRMKGAISRGELKTPKQGVSIPSQRRWLFYWSLLLSHQGPQDFWPSTVLPRAPQRRVRLVCVSLRMKLLSSVKTALIKGVGTVLGDPKSRKSNGTQRAADHLWASLARYDDKLVEHLETFEHRTRDEDGEMGRRRRGSSDLGDTGLQKPFVDDKWDRDKMVHKFAYIIATQKETIQVKDKDNDISTYTMCPVSSQVNNENKTREDLLSNKSPDEPHLVAETGVSGDIMLDANREVRIKFYMGQLFFGWLWFIPTFHMHNVTSQAATKLLFSQKDIDFSVGIGAGIVDVEVLLQ